MTNPIRMAICLLPMMLAACAAPQKGTPEHDSIQTGINALGTLLGGKPAPANPQATQATTPAQPQQSGKKVLINATNIMVEGQHPADARWQGKLIAQTPLNRFFDVHPIRRSGDYWPRIGIRIEDYSESLTEPFNPKYQNQLSGSTLPNIPRPPECIKFTAVIWMSDKQSQKIENVVHCNADIRASDTFMTTGALRSYRNLMAPISISSEQVRTLGPRVPAKLLPDTGPQDLLIYNNGQHLFSSIFTQLGYRGPLDGDQRLWFVNLTAAAK